MTSRRVLITGLSTFWGGRLARAIERDPQVEAIVGVDVDAPTCELERTEFVRVGNQHRLLRRIVSAAEIDTVVDTRLVVDSAAAPPHQAHENNVIGTMNILAACSGPDSPVRKLVFKSSAHYYGCEQDDPAFFTEEMARPHPPRTPLEKDIVEAERAVADFAQRTPRATVTVLRCANGIGPELRTSHMALLALPLVPTILGFDPRYQFIHEDDIVGALEHAVLHELPGVYNAAADGVLVLSEVLDLLDRRPLPMLPPWGTGLAAAALGRLGLRLPAEMLRQLRFGRGLDNRRLKAAGYQYRYTTREAVIALARHRRAARITAGGRGEYVYEREVDEFLRWSPHVSQRARGAAGGWRPSPREIAELQRALHALAGGEPPVADAPRLQRGDGPLAAYDELAAEEVIAVLPSLEGHDLHELRAYEASHRARTAVLGAIDRQLARRE